MRRRFSSLLIVALGIGLVQPQAAEATHTDGRLVGTVTSDDTGAPLEGVCVWADGQTDWGYATTEADGTFQIYLASGTYIVYFSACDAGNYVSEYYDDARTYEDAHSVPVAAAGETEVSAGLATGGVITGRVTDEEGNPAAVCISALDPSGYWLAETYSDPDGYYTLGGLDGQVVVSFGCGGVEVWVQEVVLSDGPPSSEFGYVSEYYDDTRSIYQATILDAPAGSLTEGIDAVLALAGAITGSITDESGQPLDDICVYAVEATDGLYEGYGYSYYQGEYQVYGLPAGSYKLQFSDCQWPERYAREWFDDQPTFQQATILDVTAGHATDADASLALMPSPDGAIESLEVKPVPLQTDAATVPGPGHQRRIEVSATNRGDGSGWGVLRVTVTTKSDGYTKTLHSEYLDLDPGETVERTVDWDATGQVGDAKITAMICLDEDIRYENNSRQVSSYAVVGGTGVGATVTSSPFTRPPSCEPVFFSQ